MTIIRPMVGAAKNYTAGKLVHQLKEKNIPYTRKINEYKIEIDFTDKKGRQYEYTFNPQTATLISKKRISSEGEYETIWKEGMVIFNMANKNKYVQITKSVSEYIQDFWNKLFHGKKQPYTLTEIDKTISTEKSKTGYTRRIFEFPNTGVKITDTIPHRSFTINYQQKYNTRYRNITNDVVERAIEYQIKRNH